MASKEVMNSRDFVPVKVVRSAQQIRADLLRIIYSQCRPVNGRVRTLTEIADASINTLLTVIALEIELLISPDEALQSFHEELLETCLEMNPKLQELEMLFGGTVFPKNSETYREFCHVLSSAVAKIDWKRKSSLVDKALSETLVLSPLEESVETLWTNFKLRLEGLLKQSKIDQ
jgi:hypothetical protein